MAAIKKKLESGSELEVEDVKKSLEFSSTPQSLYKLPVNVLFDGIKNHVWFANLLIRSQDQSGKLIFFEGRPLGAYVCLVLLERVKKRVSILFASCAYTTV